MYINDTLNKTEFTRKSGSYFREKTWHNFTCDSCSAFFCRAKGTVDPVRLSDDYNHVCNDCGASAAAKMLAAHRAKKILERYEIGEVRETWDQYNVVFVGLDDNFITRNGGGRYWARQHTYVMESHLGRSMAKGEVVHHIDGDKKNNKLENLVTMTVQEHNNCHAKSEKLIFEMVKAGLITFNRETNLYEFAESFNVL
ncbi:MAG: HNH endonuclease [Candidatus Magasanikbacteria bacterium]|jgi:hypothetical protein|nr:HNH endonuclease [Candidatus Magasanikbacteria bacterium]